MIVVTGAAGFIGSALVYGLNKKGINNIICVDKMGSDKRWENLNSVVFQDFIDKDEFIKRIRERKSLPKIKTILHMGAISSTTETDVSLLMENNFTYTKDLCIYCLEKNIRFIYASSAATYGKGEEGFSDNIELIDRLKPLNPYGFSKHIFDLWAKYNKAFNKITGLKYFNVFGPNEYHKENMRSMVLKSFEQISQTGKVKLFKSELPQYKDGEQVRDFLYIKDAVEMTLFFIEKGYKKTGLFNIGSGIPRTWNDLVKAVFKATEKPVNIEYIPMPSEISKQYQYFTKADISSLRKAGYDNKIYSLEEGIEDYVKNYLLKEPYARL